MGVLRHEEVEQFIQSDTVYQWQSQNLNPDSLAPHLISELLYYSVYKVHMVRDTMPDTPQALNRSVTVVILLLSFLLTLW